MIRAGVMAAGAVLVAAGAAQAAEPWPKWYIALHGSLPFVGRTDVSQGATNLGEMEFDNPGWGAGAALGYKPAGALGDMRFELEASRRETDVDTLAGISAADDVSVDAFMLNAFYDFHGTGMALIPYLGAGLGWANVETNLPVQNVSNSDDMFAYQFMAGVGYEPMLAPNTALILGYRYFATLDPEIGSVAGTVEHDYDSHLIEAGARFSF
jgi:opacity protein-like surface antigen